MDDDMEIPMGEEPELPVFPEDEPDKLDQDNDISNGDNFEEGAKTDVGQEDNFTSKEPGTNRDSLQDSYNERSEFRDSDEDEDLFSPDDASKSRGPRVYTSSDLGRSPSRDTDANDDDTISYSLMDDASSTSKKYRNRRLKTGMNKDNENAGEQRVKKVNFSISVVGSEENYKKRTPNESSQDALQTEKLADESEHVDAHQYWIGATGLPLPIVDGEIIKCSKKGPHSKKGHHHHHHHHHKHDDPHKHKHRHHENSLEFLRFGQLGPDGKPIASIESMEESKSRLCINMPDSNYRGFSVKLDKWGNIVADNPVVLDPNGPPLLLIKYTSLAHAVQQGNSAILKVKPFIEHSDYLPFWIVSPDGKLIALHDKNGQVWDRNHKPYPPTGSGKEPSGDLYDYYLFSGSEKPCDDINSVCFHPEILDSEDDDDEERERVVVVKREAHHTLDIDKIKKMFKHHHEHLDEEDEKPLFRSFQFPNCLKDGSYQRYMTTLGQNKSLNIKPDCKEQRVGTGRSPPVTRSR